MRKTLFLIAVLAGSGAVLIPSTPASAQACTHLGQQVTCLPDVTPGATSTGFKTADTTGVGGINWNDGSMTFNLCCPRFLTDFSEATSRFGLTNLASPGPSANIDDPLVGPPGGGLLAPLPGGPIVLDNLRNGTASPAEVASLIDSEIALFDALTG